MAPGVVADTPVAAVEVEAIPVVVEEDTVSTKCCLSFWLVLNNFICSFLIRRRWRRRWILITDSWSSANYFPNCQTKHILWKIPKKPNTLDDFCISNAALFNYHLQCLSPFLPLSLTSPHLLILILHLVSQSLSHFSCLIFFPHYSETNDTVACYVLVHPFQLSWFQLVLWFTKNDIKLYFFCHFSSFIIVIFYLSLFIKPLLPFAVQTFPLLTSLLLNLFVN